jgi:GABA(A) receptor-associated protein
MFGGLKERSFEDRSRASAKLLERYPDRIPVVVDRPPNSFARPDSIPPIGKHKFLVPNDLIMGKFIHEVRKHIKIDSQQSLFLFVNGTLMPNNESVARIYSRQKDPDGFLYITYATENTFGR